jgi:CubicO group peptidase (beta-lactamase class C family)
LSAAIVYDGRQIWTHSLGYADSNREVEVSANTPFWIASVSKSFVALTFLHLAEKAKIDLSDLASQTPNFNRTCTWLSSTQIPFAKGLECDQPITIRHILHHQNNAPAGSVFMYNPIFYSRLSRYLEHKFGQGVDAVEGRHNTLGRLIDDLILEPASMTRTMSSMWDPSKARVLQDMADGFKVTDGYLVKLPQPDKHIAGGAGVVSTITDLSKYEIALQNGTITSNKIAKKLHQPANYADGSISPYGYGWYFQQLNNTQLMWHSGKDEEAGYSALFLRIPEQKTAFILLANADSVWPTSLTNLTQAEVRESDFAALFLSHFNYDDN